MTKLTRQPYSASVTSRNAISRRLFLGGAAAAAALPRGIAQTSDARTQMEAMLKRIQPPKFPNRTFDITKYRAVGDGTKDCTDAIATAISACATAGGGTVLVPKGTFLMGAIRLKSRVNLHLAEGATLLFSTDSKQYPTVYTRFEGTECMNYSPLIYAWEQNDIAVTGLGTLDGQASQENWWGWKRDTLQNPAADRTALVAMGDKDVPVKDRVFGNGHYLRPNFFQPNRCNNVLIEGVSIKRSPMWEINPVLCKNVTVRNVKIDSHGPNNDGCDPECCTDTLIEGCVFDTGDDCIAIKSGRNRDGRRVNVPTDGVIVRNCQMKDGHGGVSIGSEVSGGIRNVFVDNCRMDSPHLDRALRIKTNSYRGGEIENIYFANTTVGQVAQAVVDIDFFYAEGRGGPDSGPFKPVVRNVVVKNVTSNKSKYALYMRGYATAPISGVTIEDCKFDNVAQADVMQHVEGLRLVNDTRNGEAMKG